MRRRNFIRTGGAAVGVPAILNGLNLNAIAQPFLFNSMRVDLERVLVLIKLNGGNDGLNTLIPLDQYTNLRLARPDVIIPQQKILPITDRLGLHPSMEGIQQLYGEGKVGMIQSVGYPDQNRSHFRSMDIWTTGSEANRFVNTGWLGRHFDITNPGYPEGYPNGDFPDPFAISMGYSLTKTCQGSISNYSVSLMDPFSVNQVPDLDSDLAGGSRYGEEMEYLRSTIEQTNAFGKRISSAAATGTNRATYPDTKLAEQLKNVAMLISGGLKTKIYVVSLGGFDTHAAQVENDPTTGAHATLLKTLSEAVAAFMEDIKQLRLEEYVLGMTFSEFGRQIKQNGSLGTDHGTAAPLMLFGGCANGQIMGHNPEISRNVEVQEGVPMQYDFRDVYGSVLMDWFGVPESSVKNIFHQGFNYLPILESCRQESVTSSHNAGYLDFKIENYPNPFTDYTNIEFTLEERTDVRLTILDALGHVVEVLIDKRLERGRHEVLFEAAGLPAGSYYFNFLVGDQPVTRKMIKLR